jgi:hypothetical protein
MSCNETGYRRSTGGLQKQNERVKWTLETVDFCEDYSVEISERPFKFVLVDSYRKAEKCPSRCLNGDLRVRNPGADSSSNLDARFQDMSVLPHVAEVIRYFYQRNHVKSSLSG